MIVPMKHITLLCVAAERTLDTRRATWNGHPTPEPNPCRNRMKLTNDHSIWQDGFDI
jgi:hypothetical protein